LGEKTNILKKQKNIKDEILTPSENEGSG